ncbi:hypothetical protein ABW21_db0200466 [Orbilia brochopaga]|nr:hypothetical protein ABW21_db0200466 [Drechslerella brochopaga]
MSVPENEPKRARLEELGESQPMDVDTAFEDIVPEDINCSCFSEPGAPENNAAENGVSENSASENSASEHTDESEAMDSETTVESEAEPEAEDDEDTSSESDDEIDPDRIASWQNHPNYGEARQIHQLLSRSVLEGYLGNSFFSDTFKSVPNPGLVVTNVASVEIPISLCKAEQLYTHARGTGDLPDDGAVVEIAASELEFRNPGWNDWIHTLTEQAVKELGVDEAARPVLELRGMLVYQNNRMPVEFKRPSTWAGTDDVGFVEVILPGDFQGGSVLLSDEAEEKKKTLDLRRGSPFDVNVVAWDPSVVHLSSVVTKGHKVTLVYAVSTRYPYTHPSGDLRAERSLDLLDALRELKKSNSPAAFVLQHTYSLSALDNKAFGPSDRFALQNLITAVDAVGGIALYCGDLVSRDTKAADENCGFGFDEDESAANSVDYLDYENRNIGHISHKLENMRKLAGATRSFERRSEWQGPILTLGKQMADLKPYDTTKDKGMEDWYQSSCIVLWPTSTVQSLREQTKDPRASWANIKGAIKSTSPRFSEKDVFGKAVVEIIVSRCLSSDFSEADIIEAAQVFEEYFSKLSERSRDRFLRVYSRNDVLVREENPSSILRKDADNLWSLKNLPKGKKWAKLLPRVMAPLKTHLKMIEVFPKWMRPYLVPIIEQMIYTKFYVSNMPADTMRTIFNLIGWQHVGLIER